MNYLDEWYNAMQQFKWKNALLNDPYFRELEAVKTEIASFIPKEDLESSLLQGHDNWLLHVLADKQPGSVFLLNEVAELIKFYKTLPAKEVYHIFLKNGKVNYRGFSEKLFEIHINYLLFSVGLNPEIGHTYEVDGDAKEIDILLNYHDQNYNIEVTKYYDVFTEELLGLATHIIGSLHKTTIARTLTLDEIFSGYIGFKKRDHSLIKKNKQLFNDGVKSFIHGYRSVKNDTILHPGKKENDDYIFHIEPTFSQNYENSYNQILDGYPGYIKFKIEANLITNRYHATTNAATLSSVADGNERLVNKIKEKLRQHRKYDKGKLIIVIAIEQAFSSFSNNRAIPIRQANIDSQAIHNAIRGKAAVILLFKELEGNSISYQKMILGDGVAYHDIFKLIDKINPAIRFIRGEVGGH